MSKSSPTKSSADDSDASPVSVAEEIDTSPERVFRSRRCDSEDGDGNGGDSGRRLNDEEKKKSENDALVSQYFERSSRQPLNRPNPINSLVDDDENENDTTAVTAIALDLTEERDNATGSRYSLWNGLSCYLLDKNKNNNYKEIEKNDEDVDKDDINNNTTLLLPSTTTPEPDNSNIMSAAVEWFERTSEMVDSFDRKPSYAFTSTSCAACNSEQTKWELCHDQQHDEHQHQQEPLCSFASEDNSLLDDDDDRPFPFVDGDRSSDADADCPPVLTRPLVRNLRNRLPVSVRHSAWRRIHSIARDGDGFATMLRNVADHENTLLVVETSDGDIFGGFAATAWSRDVERKYFGCGKAFLFSTENHETVRVHEWTGRNPYCQMYDASSGVLAMGGGGSFGLLLQDGFSKGSTGSCSTFGNPPLGEHTVFDVINFEVYGFVVKGFEDLCPVTA